MKNRQKKQGNRPLTSVQKLFLLAIIAIALAGSLLFIRFSGKKTAPPLPPEGTALPSPDHSPAHPKPASAKVAIIIDDIGNQKKLAEEFIALNLNLSYSILPQSPFAEVLAKKITAAGKDLLLHLPLEPSDPKWDPGPGALMLAMSAQTMTNTFNNDLRGFNFIGTNNHMGSKFTADSAAMHTLLSAVKDKGLFYVDSLTTAKSVGYKTARELGIKTAKRDIFLDNDQTPQAIAGQFTQLIAVAKRQGSAIAICHPHPATLKFLTAFRPTLAKDVELVGIHELVN